MTIHKSEVRLLFSEAFPTLPPVHRHNESACWVQRALDPGHNWDGPHEDATVIAIQYGHRDALIRKLRALHPVDSPHSSTMDLNVRTFRAEIIALAWTILNLDPTAQLTTAEGQPDISGANGLWVEVKYKHPTKKERQLWENMEKNSLGLRFGTGTATPSDIDPGVPTNSYSRKLTRYAADASKKFTRVQASTRVLFIQLDLDFIGAILDSDRIWQEGLPHWAAANSACYDRLVICDNWAWQSPRIDWPSHT